MIRPLSNRIIVRPFPIETLRESGIYIPDFGTEKPLSGEVMAVGPGLTTDKGTDPMSVKVGDRIMYGCYAPQNFEFEGEKLLSMCEMDVLFVME